MRVGVSRFLKAFLAAALCLAPATAQATQTPVDQSDPAVVEDQLRQDDRTQPKRKAPVVIGRPQAARTDVREPVVVGAIRVSGATALPHSAFARAIEPYAGRTLAPAELQALASDVADVARAAGFGLATAWIPEQRIVNGVLTVTLDEGRVDAIEIDGNAAIARSALAPLADGRPIRTAELERRLLTAGDIAGVRIGKVRLDRRGGRSILIVQAAHDPVQARGYLDNWGSSTVGPVRARLTVDFNGLLAGDDQLTVGGVITPGQPEEFGLVRAAYSKPIGWAGTEIGVGGYFARSQPGGSLSGRDIEGRSYEVEASVRHPIVRARSGSVWASADLRLRDARQTVNDLLARDDRLTILGGNVFAVQQVPDGRVRTRIGLSRGLALFGATEQGDPLASRRDASGVFSKVEVWAEYEQALGRGFSLLLQAEGQLADGPLLSSEEMGLGGRSFGRAWDYREYSGDRGAAGSIELRLDIESLPRPFSVLQLYGYADAGKVTNYRGGFGGGSLASAGGGVRLWMLQGLEAGIELGVPLTNDSDPTDGDDPRLSFSLGGRF
jgi:hemolysin activation/secretion protein